MTLCEAIKRYTDNAEYERTHGNLQGCLEFKQLAEWLKELKRFREQQPYEKFESVKDHIYKLAGDYKCWDNRLTEDEAVELCHILEQQPCEDTISRQAAIDALDTGLWGVEWDKVLATAMLKALPPVQPKPKTGQWVLLDECSNSGYYCSECHKKLVKEGWSGTVKKIKYCPNCGAKMIDPQESEDKE